MKIRFLLTLTLALVFSLNAFSETEKQIINIETKNSSVVLRVTEESTVEFRHYGAKVCDGSAFKSFSSMTRAGSLRNDAPAYTVAGGKCQELSALSVQYDNSDLGTDLRYVNHETATLKDGVEQTKIFLEDKSNRLAVVLVYTAYYNEDVIAMNSEITNLGKKDIKLYRYFSASVRLPRERYLLTHMYGYGNSEMRVCREMLTPGIKTIDSNTGSRSAHVANPSFMLSVNTESFNENYGEVYAGALAWNGNFDISFKMEVSGALEIVAGINPVSTPYKLYRNETLKTPEMIYTYSDRGAGQASRNLHDWVRNQWRSNGAAPLGCPVLLNSWEGAYFKINDAVLEKMVDNAAAMGLEMFVVDDGWFGGEKYPRDHDRQGLGDWTPVPSKFPDGMGRIAEYTRSKGLKFGIWIEPEMVNPASVLAEKHPDWIVKPLEHEATLGRNQWVLDLCNPEVQDYVFKIFDDVMQDTKADYIKWDCNRELLEFHSNYLKDQGRFLADYSFSMDKVIQRIRAKYPDVMIQACAGGGGRVQMWSMKYFNEFWTSDGTDAYQRIFTQYGTNLIYPAYATAAHVSAVPNHQNNNVTPLKFRFDMAATGRLGMELQPDKMTDKEKAESAIYIKNYKSFRDIVFEGDLYRLKSPYDDKLYSLMYVSKDKSRAVVFCFNFEYQSRYEKVNFRLEGLEKGASYKITELGVEKSKLWASGKTVSADYLMAVGINPALIKMYDSGVFLLEIQK